MRGGESGSQILRCAARNGDHQTQILRRDVAVMVLGVKTIIARRAVDVWGVKLFIARRAVTILGAETVIVTKRRHF